MTAWTTFLHNLGRELAALDAPVTAVLVVPRLEFAAPLIASGLVAQLARSHAPRTSPFSGSVEAQGVQFAQIRGKSAKLRFGTVQENRNEQGRLEVVSVKGSLTTTTPIASDQESTIQLLANCPFHYLGSAPRILLENAHGIRELVGQRAAYRLLEPGNKFCQIIGIGSHLESQLNERIPLNRLLPQAKESLGDILLADLVRIDGLNQTGRILTASSRGGQKPEGDYPAAIYVGSRFFTGDRFQSNSPIQIAALCPSDRGFEDALDFATDLFRSRIAGERVLSDDLLAMKPPAIDIQTLTLPS